MQYKIPVQIENEDVIFAWLSMRQLGIIAAGGGVAYSIFQSLSVRIDPKLAMVPAILVLLVAVFIALFRVSEMTFTPFLCNLLRFQINGRSRLWHQGVDSYPHIEIGYVVPVDFVFERKGEYRRDYEVYETIEDKLTKI